MHRRISLLGVGVAVCAAGCPTRDISKLDPAPAIEYRQDIPVSTNRNVDILFVIDNSDSMAGEQRSLAANFPRFIDVLNTIEGGLPNVHIGVISSDVGINPFSAEQCANDGDNGLLQNTPRCLPAPGQTTCTPTCVGPRGRYIEDVAMGAVRQRNYDGDLDDVFACIAQLGVSGCGIEQHLESMRRALNGSDSRNAGFLRSEAYLAVIILADEDDCSANDTQVFNPLMELDNISSIYGPFASYRCTEFGVLCDGATLPRVAADYQNCVPRGDSYLRHPNDYVNFLRDLKGNPNLLVTAIIAGPPKPTGVTFTTSGALKLKPSCSVMVGNETSPADPGIRLKFFGDQQGLQNTFVSICQDDLSDAMEQIARLLKKVLGTFCIGGNLDTTDIDSSTPGLQLNCSVADVQFPGQSNAVETPMARCDMSGPETPITTTVPCWWTKSNPSKCLVADSPTQTELVIERGGNDPPIGTVVTASCVVSEN